MQQDKKQHFNILTVGTLALASMGLLSVNGFAQTSSTSDFSKAAPAAKDSQSNDQAIMQELEQMRQHIADLERQLKNGSQQPSVSQPSEATTPESKGQTFPVARPGDGSMKTQPENAASAGQKKQPKEEPFAYADWTWLNGNARTKDTPYATEFFTPEIRLDAAYHYDFAHPADHTIDGSAEVFRAQELQLTQIGLGGDFHYDHVQARVMTQFGMYSQTQPRNDASPARGQWNLADAYRNFAEAYAGYHFDVLHGINVQAGLFMSYIGLFSWYNFDNWAYQPSYVSSNTPFFFNGMRVQIFPTKKLKIEPWLINGWQSYGMFNSRPGIGAQVLYRPYEWLSIVSNSYAAGADTLGNPNRIRYHTDNSVQVRYYNQPTNRGLDKMAFSFTGDLGCEHGGGVSCMGNSAQGPKQSFVGWMLYNRMWFNHDKYGFTLGGGGINNPGRYLVLLPPINGATAASGTPYFTQNPGDPFKAWDASATWDWMPSQYITFRWEYTHRHANVPYFSGSGGITPSNGSGSFVNQGAPGSFVAGFTPDLRKTENRATFALLVKF
jgi:hypothetical protein